MGNRARAAALLVLAAAVTSGCGGSDTAATAGGSERVTLKLIAPNTPQEAQERLIADFERANPNIDVKPTFISAATYPSTLLTQLRAGNTPDVMNINTGNATPVAVWPLAAGGRLLSLNDEPWVKDVYAPARSSVTSDGKVFAWPLTMNPHGVVYDVDLFERLGLTPPQTFADVLADCARVHKAGKVMFALGLASGHTGQVLLLQQRMNNYVYSTSPDWNDQRSSKALTFATTPAWKRTLDSILEMKKAGCFNRGAEGITFDDAVKLVAKGKAVGTVASALHVGAIKALNPKMNVAFFNLPPDDAANAVASIAIANSYAVSAATKHPKEAKAFLAFAARREEMRKYAEISGSVSPYEAKEGSVPEYMKSMAPLFVANKVVSTPQNGWANSNLLFGGFSPGIVGLFTGRMSVAEVLSGADRMWDNPTATSAS
jgi:raffinose/stachyose/melibiose transport system substrate-binding protein